MFPDQLHLRAALSDNVTPLLHILHKAAAQLTHPTARAPKHTTHPAQPQKLYKEETLFSHQENLCHKAKSVLNCTHGTDCTLGAVHCTLY